MQFVPGPGTVSRRQTRRTANEGRRRSWSYVKARAQPATQYAGPMLGLPKKIHREQLRQVEARRFSTRIASGGTPVAKRVTSLSSIYEG